MKDIFILIKVTQNIRNALIYSVLRRAFILTINTIATFSCLQHGGPQAWCLARQDPCRLGIEPSMGCWPNCDVEWRKVLSTLTSPFWGVGGRNYEVYCVYLNTGIRLNNTQNLISASRKVFVINLLKPSCYFKFDQVKNLKILHGARFELSVLCGYQNRQLLLLYTTLTDWFL